MSVEFAINEDFAAISQWHALQSKKVQTNAKVIGPSDATQSFMLHIDKTMPKKFIPMMPRSAAPSENNTSARITVAPTLIGCVIGYARMLDDFWYSKAMSAAKTDRFKGGYDICMIPYTHCLRPNEKLVFDAPQSDEHWLVPYSKQTLEYVPTLVGKVFLSEIHIRAVCGKSPINTFTLFIECSLDGGFMFSPGIHLARGWHKAEVTWKDRSAGDCRRAEDFKVISISQADYAAAKKLSADMLSLNEPPVGLAAPAYLGWS